MEKKASFNIPDSIKDGWRRTKQTTKVKLGKADATQDDEDFDHLVVQCKEQHQQLKRVYNAIVSHVNALKHSASSGLQLSTDLTEFYSDVAAEHRPLAVSNQKAWGETVAMSGRFLDNLMEANVLTPLQHSLAEYDRLAEIWDERVKRRMDYDYYRTKTGALEQRREKQSDEKIARNEAKLEQSRRVYEALTEEARKRMRELISERYATFGAPFTQMVSAERAFIVELHKQQEGLAQWSNDVAIAAAAQSSHARPSRRRESLSREALVAEAPVAGAYTDRSRTASVEEVGPYGRGGGGGAVAEPEVPVVSMEQLTTRDGRSGSAASNGASTGAGYAPPASQGGAQSQSNPFADLMGDSAPPAQQQQPAPGAQPGPMVDLLNDSAPAQPAQQQQQQQQQAGSELISFGAGEPLDPLVALTSSQPQQPAAVPAPAPVPAPSGGGERYQALCDYTPGDTRMLTIQKGDVLIKEREEDGWFYGSNPQGMSGYFPPNYCKKL